MQISIHSFIHKEQQEEQDKELQEKQEEQEEQMDKEEQEEKVKQEEQVKEQQQKQEEQEEPKCGNRQVKVKEGDGCLYDFKYSAFDSGKVMQNVKIHYL